jgi:transposase
MPRPTKCTENTTKRVMEAIAAGCTVEAACASAGISSSTYRDWRAQGAKGVEPFSAFLASIKKAESEAEERLLNIINKAAPQHWQAAAWVLERRFPRRWARRSYERFPLAPSRPPSPNLNLLEDGRTYQELSDAELVALAEGRH